MYVEVQTGIELFPCEQVGVGGAGDPREQVTEGVVLVGVGHGSGGAEELADAAVAVVAVKAERAR